MIGHLTGILMEKQPPEILLDVQGVGYELLLPMTSFYNLPEVGKQTSLFTHLVVREDICFLDFRKKPTALYFVNSSKPMAWGRSWRWRFCPRCQWMSLPMPLSARNYPV